MILQIMRALFANYAQIMRTFWSERNSDYAGLAQLMRKVTNYVQNYART